jgi:hypothetical protein
MGVEGAEVELCRDRAMTLSCERHTVMGDTFRPSTLLDAGAWFWRVRGRAAGRTGTGASAVWQLWIPERDSDVDSVSGVSLDVNGDGRIDLAAADGARLVVYFGGASGLSPTPSQTLDAPAPAVALSSMIAGGDLNGDGYGDLVQGATELMPPNMGGFVAFAGGPSGLAAMPMTTVVGAAESGLGFRVAVAGDTDRDGFGDLLVTANAAVLGNEPSGLVRLYRGSPSGVAPRPMLEFRGEANENFFGYSLVGGVDFDGDGLADFAVGSPSEGVGSPGRVVVFRGGSGGFGRSAMLATSLFPGTTYGDFGASIAAGDLDGDGRADLIVDNDVQVGVVPGGATGLRGADVRRATVPASPAPIRSVVVVGDLVRNAIDDVILSAADTAMGGQQLVLVRGEPGALTIDAPFLRRAREYHTAPQSIAGVGDADGDGFEDVAACSGPSIAAAELVVRTMRGPRTLVVPAGFRFVYALLAGR